MSFDHLGLRVELLEAIKTKGYTAPTPIQTKAIPVILSGRDILARAQTGTGKTDAFALPMVEILSRGKRHKRHARALVLAPTRELALQVGESIKAIGRRVSIRCTVVFGGVRIEPQVDRLNRGIDILVATPGRLLDLARHGYVDLSHIEFMVFDEADRMLDMGFSEEISGVLEYVSTERRTMLFSATYTQEIRDLAARMLKDPEYIEVTPSNTAAESVAQIVHKVGSLNKRDLLVHLITRGRWVRILVFVRTKHGANKLTEKLNAQGISAAAMHGNMSQSIRMRTLEEFKKGDIRTLVATDLAARGLDISNLPYVVNYDMPRIPEDYIHRIGRTGRAGVSGIAISLVSPEEKPILQAIETLLNHKIRVEKVDGFTEGRDVPDFVLYRPGSPTSEKKADKELVEIVARRVASKLKTKDPKTPGPGSRKPPKPKTPAGKPGGKDGKKPFGTGSRSSQVPKRGPLRGKK
ncbi:MAG: DEAD/DEAH box helicase [Proteobacteria bacterium]|nr:DEAD/DEAH box helicase [Pseudomonadota bacterium]